MRFAPLTPGARRLACASAVAVAAVAPAGAQTGGQTILSLAESRRQAAGQPTFSGTLDASDRLDPERETPYEAHTFQADANQLVTVRLTGDFDTYLTVERPDGGPAYSNDDFEGVSVSQVEFVAPAAGAYTVRAGAFSVETLQQPNESGQTPTGAYEVAVTLGGTARVELVDGRLDRQDATALKGEHYDEHTFAGRAGERVIVELEPLGFTGFLVVTTPSGRVLRTGDEHDMFYDPSGRVRIGPFEAEAGAYRVAVTTMGPGEVGAYDLRVLRFED